MGEEKKKVHPWFIVKASFYHWEDVFLRFCNMYFSDSANHISLLLSTVFFRIWKLNCGEKRRKSPNSDLLRKYLNSTSISQKWPFAFLCFFQLYFSKCKCAGGGESLRSDLLWKALCFYCPLDQASGRFWPRKSKELKKYLKSEKNSFKKVNSKSFFTFHQPASDMTLCYLMTRIAKHRQADKIKEKAQKGKNSATSIKDGFLWKLWTGQATISVKVCDEDFNVFFYIYFLYISLLRRQLHDKCDLICNVNNNLLIF